MRSVEVLPVKGYCFYVLELVIIVYQMAICGCANLFIHLLDFFSGALNNSFFWLGACLICLLCLLLFIYLVGGPLCVSLDIRTCLRVPQFFGCSSRLLWFIARLLKHSQIDISWQLAPRRQRLCILCFLSWPSNFLLW